MRKDFFEIIQQATGASDISLVEVIQELWSGYGTIKRFRLTGSDRNHIIVKHVHFPDLRHHPRNGNTDLSHQRKLHSYEVEKNWYSNWSYLCGTDCPVPHCLALQTRGDETVIVLEDLCESGFSEKREAVSKAEITACLCWLANFHATFMGCEPRGLWEQGTYWHLKTRPDELEALNDMKLKNTATHIDQLLKTSPYQTLVHGDAKLANFCFSQDSGKVAAVDFQYIGGGCGMKDVAYFIGSCLNEADCERHESWLLDSYFAELRQALYRGQKTIDVEAVEESWRELFPIAWTDFHRFLKGWNPGHWKLNTYSEKLASKVVHKLRGER